MTNLTVTKPATLLIRQWAVPDPILPITHKFVDLSLTSIQHAR